MRKVYLNNDRNQIAFFVGLLSDSSVVIETQSGELKILPINNVGMLDLTEREHYNFLEINDKRKFDTYKDIFISLLSKVNNAENISDEEIIDIYNISKKYADIFIQQYKENNQ